MSFRNILLFAAIIALVSGRPALSQIYSTAVKPPSVIVSDESGNELDRIPLAERPEGMAYSKAANRVYVFHQAKEGGSISVVNVAEHRVGQEIPVGPSHSPGGGQELGAHLVVSGDGHQLFCYAAFMLPTKGFKHYPPGLTRLDLKPEFQPVITVIDTSSNEVVATYSGWWESLRAVMPKGFATAAILSSNNDGSQLLALFRPHWWPRPTEHEEIFVFSGSGPQPTFKMDPGGHVVNVVLSRDGKFLITAIDKGKKTPGGITVANMESGSTASHNLADDPRVFIRLGQSQSLWVLGEQEMRPVSETGEVGERAIRLNQLRKSEEGDTEDAEALLNGYPGETISLGESRAAVLIVNPQGASAHRVALLDLSQFRVDAVVTTMSSSEIAKLHTGNFLKAFAADVAVGVALGPTAPSPFMTALMTRGLANEALAARPDGKYLYALDTDIHALTVIDVDAATVLKRIPVDSSVVRIQVSPDGKDLLCIGKKTGKLDLNSNNMEN